MNEVLEEIITTGLVTVPTTGERKPVHSHISPQAGDFLRDLVRNENPKVIVAIGLAFAISALYICDALEVREDTRYVAIDPNQYGGQWGNDWEGTGLSNLERANYADFVELIEKPSFEALPALEAEGIKADFAFIDGWHTFDHALIDFFYLDRILRVGGIIAMDDSDWPAIRKLCRFIATNRAYSVVGKVGEETAPSWRHRCLKGGISSTPFRRLIKPEILTSARDLKIDGSFVAFRKMKDDDRRWDHYRAF